MQASTLMRWVRGEGVNADVRATQQEKNARHDALLENEARAAILAAPDVREDANYAQLLTGAAICIDKMQLLRNKPTAINEDRISVEDKRRALREFLLNEEECQPSAILN